MSLNNLKQIILSHAMYLQDSTKNLSYKNGTALWISQLMVYHAPVNQVRSCPVASRESVTRIPKNQAM